MKKVFFIAFLVFLLFASIGHAQEIPTLKKYVNDYADALSASDESRIDSLCAEIEKNWTVEIAVLTVNTTQPMTIEEYAVKAFEKNGIGKKDKDNGLLIVAAIEDRKWRFEVGYGLEPIINDAKAGRIGRAYLTTYFKEGDYANGLYYAVDAISKIIQNSGDDSFISEQSTSDESSTPEIILIIIFTLLPFIIIISVFTSFFINRCPQCGTRMKCHYDKDEYLVCECPKCGKKTKKKKRSNFWFFIGGFHGGGGFSGGGGGFGGGGSGGGGSSGGW